MAKGNSKAGGGGAKVPAQTGPAKVEGDNHVVNVRMDDGTHKEVNVSIQDTSQYDDLEGKDYISRVDGRREVGSLNRSLACEAERNALDDKRENFMTEPETKAGKWTKTADVPILRNTGTATVLEKSNGYVTKLGNENLYLQKTGDGWKYNFKGLTVGQTFKSLAAAKAGVNGITQQLTSSSLSEGIKGARAQFKALNKNKGRISKGVWKEMDFKHIANRTYD